MRNRYFFAVASLVIISSIPTATFAQSASTSVIDQMLRDIGERNRVYGEESQRRVSEAVRQHFITSGMTPEEIYFLKIRADLLVVSRAALHGRLRERGISEEQTEKLIQELANEFLSCQMASWRTMPADLRQHILFLTKSAPSVQAAHRMAMEDYKAKTLASGKSESVYVSEVEKWSSVYKVCTEKSRSKFDF